MGAEHTVLLLDADPEFSRQSPPAPDTTENQRMFETGGLERQDSIRGPNGAIERGGSDVRGQPAPRTRLRGVRKHTLEGPPPKRNFDLQCNGEHFHAEEHKPQPTSVYHNEPQRFAGFSITTIAIDTSES